MEKLFLLLVAIALLSGCKEKNQAPDRAAVPSGPTTGHRDSVLILTGHATDPDGDSVALRFSWGDGHTSDWSGLVESDATVSDTHRWVLADTYQVRAQAKDAAGKASDWSGPLLVVVLANLPPNVPAAPSGPASGQADSFRIFTTATTDPDGDGVSYRFDWGDGDTSAWSGWLASGTPGADSHSWSANGTYLVRAQAKDGTELRSDWSQPLAVTIVGGWARTFGGAANDAGAAVQQCTDGGYIIVGKTQSYGAGDFDVYLVKTDSSAREAWTRTYGGAGWDEGFSVQPTSDGGYIVAGTTDSYGSGDAELWLIKADATGTETWAKTFGDDGADAGYSAQQTSDGGYVVAGWTTSYGGGNRDVYLIKTDAAGEEDWDETFGGAGFDEGYSVRQTTDGGYILAGLTDSAGNGGAYLVKTDTSGSQVWAKTFGGSADDIAYSVRQTSDGGYIIAGGTESYGTGDFDVYLVKTDTDGNQVWARTYGGAGWDCGYSVRPTADGGYILVGETKSFGAGSSDVYLLRTDASGDTLWTRIYGGAAQDMGNSVLQTSDGRFIVAGTTASYGAGGDDVWLIRIDAEETTIRTSSPSIRPRIYWTNSDPYVTP